MSVDRSELERRVAEALAELREEYRAELPPLAHDLESFVAKESWGEAKSAAHRLRGTAGSYGFDDVAVAAGSIEEEIAKALARGDFDASKAKIAAALADLKRAITHTTSPSPPSEETST